MALFFDSDWFYQRLREKGADREAFATALGVNSEIMEMIWKDQRALTLDEVHKAAAFFDLPAETIIDRAGIATPQASLKGENELAVHLSNIAFKLERIEYQLADLKHLLLAQNAPKL